MAELRIAARRRTLPRPRTTGQTYQNARGDSGRRREKTGGSPRARTGQEQQPRAQEYNRRYAQEHRQKAKELGICKSCSNPSIPGQTRLSGCASAIAAGANPEPSYTSSKNLIRKVLDFDQLGGPVWSRAGAVDPEEGAGVRQGPASAVGGGGMRTGVAAGGGLLNRLRKNSLAGSTWPIVCTVTTFSGGVELRLDLQRAV